MFRDDGAYILWRVFVRARRIFDTFGGIFDTFGGVFDCRFALHCFARFVSGIGNGFDYRRFDRCCMRWI